MNPLSRLRSRAAHRLSHAIDWRVRKQFEDERTVILGMNKTITDLSAESADQILKLQAAVKALESRIVAIEKSTGRS